MPLAVTMIPESPENLRRGLERDERLSHSQKWGFEEF